MLLLIWSLFWTENTEQGRNTHSLDVTPYQLVSAHFDFASHGSVHGNTKQSGIPAEKNTSVWPARGSQNIRQSIQTGRPSLPAGKCFWITTFNANVTSKAKRKSQPFVAHFNQVIGKLNTLVAGKKKNKKNKKVYQSDQNEIRQLVADQNEQDFSRKTRTQANTLCSGGKCKRLAAGRTKLDCSAGIPVCFMRPCTEPWLAKSKWTEMKTRDCLFFK